MKSKIENADFSARSESGIILFFPEIVPEGTKKNPLIVILKGWFTKHFNANRIKSFYETVRNC